MGKKVRMLTVVPVSLAAELVQKKKIQDYNTLPQINNVVLKVIREYMVERIGYENLPMACLSGMENNKSKINGEDILSYLPLNSKDSVIFQLEMPDDMIVSISFSDLLNLSQEASGLDADSDVDNDYLMEQLQERAVLGFDSSMTDPICFIPFLAYDRCKCFVRLTDNFTVEELQLTGISEINLRELTSFTN